MALSAPHIECDHVFPLLAVKSIKDAVEYYIDKLGFRLQFTWGNPPNFRG